MTRQMADQQHHLALIPTLLPQGEGLSIPSPCGTTPWMEEVERSLEPESRGAGVRAAWVQEIYKDSGEDRDD